MAKDSPSTSDFLFRDGQAWYGTQEGKRNEMVHGILEQEKAQTGLMRDMIEAQKRNEMTVPYRPDPQPTSPVYYPEYTPPVINIQGIAEEMRPQFENLFAAQRELGEKVNNLGYVGQMALQESKVHTGLMERLNGEAQVAYHQRNEELHRLGQSIVSQRTANIQLDNIGQGISGVDHSVNRAAAGLSRVMGLSTAILSGDIGRLEQSLSASLGDISYDISHLSHEVVKTRLEVVDELQKSQAIFLWSHREQMWVRRQILDVLRNPRRTAAREAWELGEKCRLFGDAAEALRMYGESVRINPSEARNYVSLGLMNLNEANPEAAKKFFEKGAGYAEEPALKGTAMMYLAKMDMFDKEYRMAKETLESALAVDITNLEIWFDLAICEMKSGDAKKALYYIKNLLHAPLRVPRNRKQEAAQYALKIVAESCFAPLMGEIRNIMREIINNTK